MIRYVGLGYRSDPHVELLGTNDSYLGGLRVTFGESAKTPYLQIHTDEAYTEVTSVRVSVQWRTVWKDVAGGFGQLSDVIWSLYESPSTELTHRSSSPYSGTDWSVPFSDIGEYYGGGDVLTETHSSLQEQLFPDGWTFAKRIYDAVGLNFVVAFVFSDGRESRVVNTEQWVVCFPEFELLSATIRDEAMQVTYLVKGWDRPDDRWHLESAVQDGKELAKSGSIGNVNFGTIDAPGYISIPLTAFSSLPKAGSIDLRIHVNAHFRTEGSSFVYIDGTTDVTNGADCNSMSLTLAQATTERITLVATDLDDRSNDLVRAWAGIVGYDMSVTASFQSGPTRTANLRLDNPPLGVPLTIEGIGFDADGDSSESAWVEVPAIMDESGLPTCPTVTAEDGSASVELRYNGSTDWTYEPTYEVVKFSGRFRESVAYGIGGPITGTLSCDILSDEAYGSLHQSREDFEALAFAGVCLYRDPDGMRRRVMVESVGESWDRVRFVRTMKISVREVE